MIDTDHGNDIKMTASAKQYIGENYEEVVYELQDAGFTNIETNAMGDLVTGWLKKEENIEKISINGDTDFEEGEYFSEDAKIRITYHSFPKEE